jgi:hypothetical protein
VRTRVVLAILALFAFSGSAFADTLDTFSFVQNGFTTPSFSFTLPATPTVLFYDYGNPQENYFLTTPCVPAQLGPVTVSACLRVYENEFTFNSNDDVVDVSGIFTGTMQDPTFVPGVYVATFQNFYEAAGITSGPAVSGTLTITQTPEPSSVVLLASGLLTGAWLLYQRRSALRA